MLKLRKRYPICYPNIIIDGKERTEDAMEKDMKKQIAEASRELLFEDQLKLRRMWIFIQLPEWQLELPAQSLQIL